MNNPISIIQARMDSTRLPGKILLPLGERTVLEQVIQRVNRVSNLNKTVIATTTKPSDDPVARLVESLDHIALFRGDEHDVLDRYYKAAKTFQADPVIRITADCPLMDHNLLEEMLTTFLHDQHADYYSNTQTPRTYPRGIDIEIFTFNALEKAWRSATKSFEREHVTPYLYNHAHLFKLEKKISEEGNYSDHRWTLDTEADYQFLQKIFNHFDSQKDLCSRKDIIDFLEHNPELQKINAHVKQKSLTS
ncbi:cytidylyltransferase domain-containing protein [Magnetococcales bacterium HHB-1]